MAATSFSPGVRHPAISAPITIAIMGIRENLSAAIVSAPLCQVAWSQARILPAQDRGLLPFLDLEFVAREHRAHRLAAILRPGRGRGQHNRCHFPFAAPFKRPALIFEVEPGPAILVETQGGGPGGADDSEKR